MSLKPYKVTFRSENTQWVRSRHHTLSAALCAARRMEAKNRATCIQVMDGRNGKTWFVGPQT